MLPKLTAADCKLLIDALTSLIDKTKGLTDRYAAGLATEAERLELAQLTDETMGVGAPHDAATATILGCTGLDEIARLADASSQRYTRLRLAVDGARAALEHEDEPSERAEAATPALADAVQHEAAAFRSWMQAKRTNEHDDYHDVRPIELSPHTELPSSLGVSRWLHVICEPKQRNERWVLLPWRVPVPDDEGWPDELAGHDVPRLSLELARFLRERGAVDVSRWWLSWEISREHGRANAPVFEGIPSELPLRSWFCSEATGPSQAIVTLALSAWRLSVRAEVAAAREMRDRTKGPALLPGFHALLLDRHAEPRGSVFEHDRVPFKLVAPALDAAALRAFERGLSAGHGLDARRTWIWLADVGWQASTEGARGARGNGWEAVIQGDRTALVTIEGGANVLAELVGVTSGSKRRVPLDFLSALARMTMEGELPDGATQTGSLVTVTTEPAAPGRRAVLRVRLSAWLLPGAVQRVPRNGSRRPYLVPIKPLPPLEAVNARWQPAAAALEVCATEHLAANALELVTMGGVPFDWRAEGKARGLTAGTVDAFTEGLTTARWWQERPGGRWTLGDADEVRLALELLQDSGTLRRAGRDKARRRKDR